MMVEHPPADPADKWQKFYYRGTDAGGHPGTHDHQTKLQARPWPALTLEL